MDPNRRTGRTQRSIEECIEVSKRGPVIFVGRSVHFLDLVERRFLHLGAKRIRPRELEAHGNMIRLIPFEGLGKKTRGFNGHVIVDHDAARP